ncbi:MAG TPA: sugar ABC transporter substrate-binding protein [Candidatus Limnocylindrales bacterium]|nr:sugar ABC transporter substrate-binding protein [Candidatus Limnocylindrales bacterium]
MRKRFLSMTFAAAFIAAACTGGGASNAPTGGTGATTGTGSTAGTGETQAPQFDPSTISGDVTLGQWESSPAEGTALKAALDAFAVKYPNIKVTQTTIAGDYRAQMVNKFGAADVPDLFYVNAEYAPEWMSQGFLLPLDDYINNQGFDTAPFFPDYLSIFQQDGVTYGLPKDGNTIAMAVNTDLVPTPPTTLDELVQVATSLKGKSGLKAPMCLNASLDRGLGFIYANGGSLLTDDGTASAIDTDASKAAVQSYMDLFKNGLGQTNTQLGDGWCGEALGKGDVAIVFEGGWLKGAMDAFPDIKWQFAEMPTGSSGQKVTINYTAAYGIGQDSKNKDQAWVLMQYLTGPEGMAKWTEGGIAVPSRSDVPVPEGFDVIVKGADYAKPGSGFMPNYPDVLKAFGDAFLKQVTDKTYDAGPVVTATKAAIDSALSSQ